MEIQKTDGGDDDSLEAPKRIEHSIFKSAEADAYTEDLTEFTMNMITAFLQTVPEIDWPADAEGNIAAYLKTVDDTAQEEVMTFVNYVHETGPAFKRTDEDSLLLEKGKDAYGRWKGKEYTLNKYLDRLDGQAVELTEAFMFEEDPEASTALGTRIEKIRITLNGVMDTARLDHDDAVFRRVKDSLSGSFGADLGDDSWE